MTAYVVEGFYQGEMLEVGTFEANNEVHALVKAGISEQAANIPGGTILRARLKGADT